MAEKNSKFPYIVLPSLSEDKKTVPGGPTEPLPSSGRKESAVKSGSVSTGPSSSSMKLPRFSVSVPSSSDKDHQNQHGTTPLTPPSKGLSRHLALSKQFTATNNNPPKTTTPTKPSKELQTMRQEVLQAHYEMRKSPRSFYLFDDQVNTIPETNSSEENLLEESLSATKLDFEALSQIFPHRSRQKSARTQLKPPQPKNPGGDGPKTVKTSRKSVSLATVVNVHNVKAVLDKVVNASASSSSVTTAASTSSSESNVNQLKTRIDGLTVHVKQRDADFSSLKENVIELQLMILKEKKESERSNELMERLSTEIECLGKKLDSVETKLMNQESSILNKLLLIDEMGDSDSDSDFGKINEGKAATWIATASSSNTTSNPSKVQSNSSIGSQGPNPNQSSGISSLKECVNWVPIAPDFDKLLNVIYLLNFRMDRNQSMKLSRNGNEATFKHADTIQMKVYKNGLILGNTGFRSYATLSVIKLINELFNGYFPTELQSQYPDGVVFVITDKRSIVHHLSPGFNSPGVKLSDSKSVPGLIPGAAGLAGGGGVVRKSEEASLPSRYSSLSSISQELSAFSGQTVACTCLPDLCKTCPKGHKMITLKLKHLSNGNCYKLRLSTSNKINQVLEHFAQHLQESDGDNGDGDAEQESENPKKTKAKFDIILPVPYGILTSGNSTLKEYGFTTNTLLYIQQSDPEVCCESAPESEAT